MHGSHLIQSSAKADYYDPDTWEVFLQHGDMIDQKAVDRLTVLELLEVEENIHGHIVGEVRKQWINQGRHRSAVARVSLTRSGIGDLRVNGKPAPEYFARTPQKGRLFLQRLLDMPAVKKRLRELDAVAFVVGSTETSLQQPHAVAHALARTLWLYDKELRDILRKAGYGKRKVASDERIDDEE